MGAKSLLLLYHCDITVVPHDRDGISDNDPLVVDRTVASDHSQI